MSEKIFFHNSKGDKLCGILSATEDKSKLMVIMCHGFSSSKDGKKFSTLEENFNKKGISTFRFDYYGHGESEGKFEDITTTEGIDDTKQAIAFMRKQGFENIALIGSSYGGICAIIVASEDNNIKALVLISPVSSWKDDVIAAKKTNTMEEWKKQGYTYYLSGSGAKLKLNYSFAEDALSIDGYKAAETITAPTLITHGDNDKSVPLRQSEKTASIIKNCTLKVLKGCDHGYSREEDFDILIKETVDFISKF